VGRRVRSNLWSDVTGLRTGPSAKTRPRWVPHCPPCPQSTYVWLLASPYLLNSAAFLWPARARTPPPPTSPRPSWCSADSARSRGTRRAGSRARTPRGSTTGCTRAGARSARSWYVRVPCYPPCQDTTWEYDWVYESVPGHHVGVRLGVRELALARLAAGMCGSPVTLSEKILCHSGKGCTHTTRTLCGVPKPLSGTSPRAEG
jgi:hypothetical protein